MRRLRDWRDLFLRLWEYLHLLHVASIFLAVLLALVLYYQQGAFEQFAASYGYASILVVSVLGNATVIAPAPSIVAILALAINLAPLPAALTAGVGSGIGELTGYLFGLSFHKTWRFSLLGYEFGSQRAIDKELDSTWYNYIETFITQWGSVAIFVLSAVPNFLFDLGGILAGLTKMAWWKFLSAAILGKTVRYLILLYLF